MSIAKENDSSDLLLLRQEIKAIRDRVVMDLDAALAKVDAALHEEEPGCRRRKTAAEYKAERAAERRHA